MILIFVFQRFETKSGFPFFDSHCICIYIGNDQANCRVQGKSEGGGGGGGHFYIFAYWVCAAREAPICSPKFPLRSISFSQMTKYSAPEHHHFIFFAVPETISFEMSLRSSRLSPPTAGLLQPARTQSAMQSVRAALQRLAAGQSASKTRPTVSSGDPHFHARARSGAPHFYARACSGAPPPPFFTLPRHIITKIWGECPHPPGGGGGQVPGHCRTRQGLFPCAYVNVASVCL